MQHTITRVVPGSIADELGIQPGFRLLSIDGEDIADIIDYEAFTAKEQMKVCFLANDGAIVEADIEKDLYEPLGLDFAQGLMSSVKTCKNKCIFCFIDQMPKHGRKSLYVKDDDWRMSFIMGNYISLTNIDDAEFSRILARGVGPLYVSVHATDPGVRRFMMGNPHAGSIMERLARFAAAEIKVHCQIVLCPGVNDGAVLEKTLEDLFSLYPSVQSVAVIPVGLTRHREGLYPLRRFTREESARVIDSLVRLQREYRLKTGISFLYVADEFYGLADYELPPYETYDDFVQLENGVGLLRKFEHEFIEALAQMRPLEKRVTLNGVTGMAAYAFLSRLMRLLEPYGMDVRMHCVTNRFFGESVTVAGLVCAGDIVEQLGGTLSNAPVILPGSMLREGASVFLDGMTLKALQDALHTAVHPVCPYDGELFIRDLFSLFS